MTIPTDRSVWIEQTWGFQEDEKLWDVHLRMGNFITVLQVEAPEQEAQELADLLEERIPALVAAKEKRQNARSRRMEAERKAEQERTRPAREKAERKRQKEIAAAPRVEAAKCPHCEHVADQQEFEEAGPGYECSRCGSTGIGEEGRRCDNDNLFRSRTTDYGCLSCEQPVEDEELQTVTAVELGGEFVEVPEEETNG